MDHSLGFVFNEDNGSTMVVQCLLNANLFIEKNPKNKKPTMQVI
jgi:hypothetical protein